MDESLNNDISIKINPSDNQCPICFEDCDPTILIKTNCNHSFCENCLNDWLKQSKYSCPLCREDIQSYHKNNEITRILPIIIKESVENLRINNIPVINIINLLIYKNYKYKIYIMLSLGFNIYSVIMRNNLNYKYMNLYNIYRQCEKNNTNLEEIIEYQDNNHNFNIIV